MAGENIITGVLNKYGAQISADVKDTIKRKPLTKYGVVNASGKLADSVRYDIKDAVMRVYSLDYIYYLEKGRKNGKRPPRKAIEQWIKDKGIISQLKLSSLAYLIQRKIGEQGTTAYIQGGTKLLEDIVNDELRGNIQSELILNMQKLVLSTMKSNIVGK